MAATFISKGWRILNKRGPKALLGAARRKFFDRHRSIWFALTLDDEIKVIKPKFEGWLDFDHSETVIDWIRQRDIPGTNDPLEISKMQERSQYFVGIMNEDRIIGYIKIGWDTVYVLDYGIDLRIPPKCYFIIDIYVAPENRGQGAGPFLVSAVMVEMKKRGYIGSYMHVRTDKTPMLRTCARTGYREIGRVDYISIAGRRIFRPHPSSLLFDTINE